MKKNIKYAVLSSGYPNNEKPNTMGFVHSRLRAYNQLGIQTDVFLIGEKKQYSFEGISVHVNTKEEIKNILDKNNYDAILIHFLDQDKIDIVGEKKCVIWVHGFEALSWKRRLFNLNPRLPLYIFDNTKQLKCFKKYAMSHPDSKFIFVSKWMYDITCEDIGYKIDNYEIVHNYIDPGIFTFEKKSEDKRKKLLLIRSFANKKYANDITVKFIKKLSRKKYFCDLEILIYGDGKLFNSLTKRLRKFNNVTINHRFITQGEIAKIQKEYGIFLCPTRQDAQGVSMCEAMSSGLVPITSDNTAIPEFVDKDKEGMLCDNGNIESFVEAYERLYYDADLFIKMSESASKRVQAQCSMENTINKEIQITNSLMLL